MELLVTAQTQKVFQHQYSLVGKQHSSDNNKFWFGRKSWEAGGGYAPLLSYASSVPTPIGDLKRWLNFKNELVSMWLAIIIILATVVSWLLFQHCSEDNESWPLKCRRNKEWDLKADIEETVLFKKCRDKRKTHIRGVLQWVLSP